LQVCVKLCEKKVLLYGVKHGICQISKTVQNLHYRPEFRLCKISLTGRVGGGSERSLTGTESSTEELLVRDFIAVLKSGYG